MGGMKNFYILFAVLVVGGIVALAVVRRGASLPVTPIAASDVLAASGWPGYVMGSADAPVEVIEWADFECNACQYSWLFTIRTVKERLVNTGRVRFVFRDFPLDQIHPHARAAHHAAACADDQGLFEPVHDLLFTNQRDWTRETGTGEGTFRGYAQEAGADMAEYDACMSEGRHRARIQASLEAGQAIGVGSTPTFQIGGSLYPGMSYEELVAIVDSLEAEAASESQ